jgi:DNA-binding transcriptional ArsR family regulator
MKDIEIPKIEINNTDDELARYARAIAWPIRVSILRILCDHENPISLDVFVSNSEFRWAISRHLTELKKMGLLHQEMINRKAYYSINKETFKKMGLDFKMLFSKPLD